MSQAKNGGYTQPDKQFVCIGHQVKAQMIQANESSGSSSARPNTLSYWSSLESQYTPNLRSCESEGVRELMCSLPMTNRSQMHWSSSHKTSAPALPGDIIGCHLSRGRGCLGVTCPECKQDLVCMTTCLDSQLLASAGDVERSTPSIAMSERECRSVFVPSDVTNKC